MAVAPSLRISTRSIANMGNECSKIHEAGTVIRLHRGQNLSTPVEQYQRGGDAESTQVHVGGSNREVLGEVVGVVLRPGIDRQDADQVADVLEAGVEQILSLVGSTAATGNRLGERSGYRSLER